MSDNQALLKRIAVQAVISVGLFFFFRWAAKKLIKKAALSLSLKNAENIFDQIDKNQDGIISKEDYEAQLKIAYPAGFPEGKEEEEWRIFNEMD